MKLVAVTRILDEADIVEAFVRHTATYVSHHLFADNGSNDGTLDILRQLKSDGFALSVIQNRSVSYNEETSNTRLFRQAVGEFAADWVIFLDTDEFIDDRKAAGGLRSILFRGSAGSAPVCLKVALTHYHATSHDDADERNVALRITRRAGVSDVHKVIVGARFDGLRATIANGSHDVLLPDGHAAPSRLVPDLTYAHYAERSSAQYVTKFVKGWVKVLAAGEGVVELGTSSHYRAPFEFLRDRPSDLLRDAHFLGHRHQEMATEIDPIAYRGGPLVYTPALDEEMRAVRSLVGYMQDLALQHGRLLAESPDARDLVHSWNSRFVQLV